MSEWTAPMAGWYQFGDPLSGEARPPSRSHCRQSRSVALLPAPNSSESDGQPIRVFAQVKPGALGGTRTPSLLIRSQMLYPLSYERRTNPG
jgi:hypothetical protein